MTNRFLMSVAAAALIAGTGFANAQGMNREGGAASGAATQSAPSSEHAAPSGAVNHDSGAAKGAESGMKAESNEKMPASKSAHDSKMAPTGEKSKSMSSETDSTKGGMKGEGAKAEGSKAEGSKAAEGSKTNGSTTAQTKGGMDNKTTTGNAATSATAAPPAEKRTQIVSAIKSEKIEETTNVNFNVSVGATVPATVRFHPLPARIVEIYPEWRGYDVIFVHGRYIIVRPQTHEIVYIIEG